LAQTVPQMPDEEGPRHFGARRADALVAMAMARISKDQDPDRATVVVHAGAGAPGLPGAPGHRFEIEDGPAIPVQTAERLLCHARVQTVVENAAGDVTHLGRMSRDPSEWMLRQLRYRDRGCTFPGCGTRRFAEAHHVV